MISTVRLNIAAIVCAALAVADAPACMVALPLAAMADLAGQVVAGEVVAVRSYWASDPRRIETEVTLAGVEYLKGELAGEADDTFRLVVPGGAVGDWQMRLCCAPEFAVGERWVLFVLPEYRTHPVVGMRQGAFRLQRGLDGVERVLSAEGRPMAALGADGFLRTAEVEPAMRPSGAPLRHAEGARVTAASGRVSARRAASPGAVAGGDSPEAAMSWQEFKAAIAPVLAASKDHYLTAPAGRRIAVELRAVPLRASPADAANAADLRDAASAVPDLTGPRTRAQVAPGVEGRP
jgi:hypothetical protein